MKFVIGTTSVPKKTSLKKILRQLGIRPESIVGFAAESGVPETPWDRETYDGARNRAIHASQEVENADYYLGVESGLIERYGHVFEEAWCCVLTTDEKEFFGYSSGLLVPDFIIRKMDELNLPHNQVMKILEDEGSIVKDTWANYSGEVISRSVSLEEAIRNALLQVFANEKSFYKRKLK